MNYFEFAINSVIGDAIFWTWCAVVTVVALYVYFKIAKIFINDEKGLVVFGHNVFPNHSKPDGIELILCAIIVFVCQLAGYLLAFIVVSVWPILIFLAFIAGVLYTARFVVRLKKVAGWITKSVHKHPDTVETETVIMPEYDEMEM